MIIARTGRCLTCLTEAVFSLDVKDTKAPFWYSDACGCEPKGLPMPTEKEAETYAFLLEQTALSLGAGDMDREHDPNRGCGGEWRSSFHKGYSDGHEVFQLAKNHPNRIVFSEKEHKKVLAENGLNPEDGGMTRMWNPKNPLDERVEY